MGTVIEATASARPGPWARLTGRPSSVRLATSAARTSLRRAGRSPEEVDLLVNAGIYADGHVAEPANAAFIQRRLGANASPSSSRRTLSFDLTGGGCGVLSALRVVDGFLASGRIELGLVVASDVDAAPRWSRNWAFAPAGAAAVLRRGGDDEGFLAWSVRSFHEHLDLFEARLVRMDGGAETGRAPQAIAIQEKTEYPLRCVECAADAIRDFLEELGLGADDLGAVVPSQHPAGFPGGLAERLGLPRPRVLQVNGSERPPHTAGVLAALEAGLASGTVAAGDPVLFAAVGAGITVSLALYRVPAPR